MKNHQLSMTIDEQIENLRKKGLAIHNEDYARTFLNDVSYFRLIKAFSLSLKEKNGIYHENTCFEDIVDLYLFNAGFRQRLSVQIEKVEINLRCRLSNYFCGEYGVFGYENPDIFTIPNFSDLFLKEIQKEITRNSKVPFVKNFTLNYVDGKIPFYALVELFSFGMLSRFYKNLWNEDKKKIANSYHINYKYFESWIESLSYVRNVCAHYGRIYDAKLIKAPKLYKQYQAMGISNYSIFSSLLSLKYLLPNDRHWYEFVEEIGLLIEKYHSVQLCLIGFPDSWKDILLS